MIDEYGPCVTCGIQCEPDPSGSVLCPKCYEWERFIREVAEEYDEVNNRQSFGINGDMSGVPAAHYEAWSHYAAQITAQWRCLPRKPRIEYWGYEPYIDVVHLRRDVLYLDRLMVWDGLPFADNHPAQWTVHMHTEFHKLAYLVRALHDIRVHIIGGLGFDFKDELRGALLERPNFAGDASPAQWTDDVGIACYREYFGKWPEVQRPVIITPRWEELEELLRGEK